MNFIQTFARFKNFNPQTEANKDQKVKVLNNAGNSFNEMYYIYKEKHEEEKDGLNDKDTKKFDYTKLRLTDDYEYESEKKKKKLIKSLIKKNRQKKQQKIVLKNLVN